MTDRQFEIVLYGASGFTGKLEALGYKELLGHIEGGQPLEMALDIAKQRTRRFVRRQHSWFRRDPRIEWFDLDAVDVGHVVERVLPLLQ